MTAPSPTLSASAPRPRATVATVLRSSGETTTNYTARQFAGWLGLSEKAIKKRLPDISAACDVRGQKAKAWPVEILPVEWRKRLQSLATVRGFRSIHDLLTSENSRPRWTPDKPWTEVEERFQKDAVHWRDALSDIMPRWVSGESRSELLILARAELFEGRKA